MNTITMLLVLIIAASVAIVQVVEHNRIYQVTITANIIVPMIVAALLWMTINVIRLSRKLNKALDALEKQQ
jgi:hypothetical protein